jgi:hypothetical protein
MELDKIYENGYRCALDIVREQLVKLTNTSINDRVLRERLDVYIEQLNNYNA